MFCSECAGLGDKVTAAAFNRRMLCYPMGGNDVDGVEAGGYSDHVLIAPAYIASEHVRECSLAPTSSRQTEFCHLHSETCTLQEIDEIVKRLKHALADVFSEPDVIAAMDAAA